jgi:hypothetical protein
MGNSDGAVTEPVPPEPHKIVSSTRLEPDKTRKDTSRRDDDNRNTNFSTSNIELKAERGGKQWRQETGDQISSLHDIC